MMQVFPSINTIVLITAVLLLIGYPVSALMAEPDFSSLVHGSDQIVIGKIISVTSSWNRDKTGIISTVQVQVQNTLKGKKGNRIRITVPGGSVGDITQWSVDEPVFKNGYIVGLFLKKNNNNDYSVIGHRYGSIWLSTNPKIMYGLRASSSDRIEYLAAPTPGSFRAAVSKVLEGGVLRSLPLESLGYETEPSSQGPKISGITISTVSPVEQSAGTRQKIRISGSGFGTYNIQTSDVMFTRYMDSEQILTIPASGNPKKTYPNCILSWSDVYIETYVPSGIYYGQDISACSGAVWVKVGDTSSNNYPFAVPFGVKTFNGKTCKWGEFRANYYYDINISIKGYTSLIKGCATGWSSSSSRFKFKEMGVSGNPAPSRDRRSVVKMAINYEDYNLTGVYANTTLWIDTKHNRVLEADTLISPVVTDDTILRSVMLHEFGHWLPLMDVNGGYNNLASFNHYKFDYTPYNKVMCAAEGYGGHSWPQEPSYPDRQGVAWLYPPKTTGTVYTNKTTAQLPEETAVFGSIPGPGLIPSGPRPASSPLLSSELLKSNLKLIDNGLEYPHFQSTGGDPR